MNPIIEISNVTKKYRVIKHRSGILGATKDIFRPKVDEVIAVEDLSFKIKRGEILGLIGPNGSGKSTTIKMLTGILKVDKGEIFVMDRDPFENRKQIMLHMGVMFGQKSQLWWDIPLINSYELLRDIYKIDEQTYKQNLNELTEYLGLETLLNKPVREMSLGQRMRSEIAAIFIHNPDIVILDEPTIGLDIVVKKNIREYIKRHNQKYGTTVLLTTHDMNDIASLCNNIIIINKGKKIYEGAIRQIKENIDSISKLMVILENGLKYQEKMGKIGFEAKEILQEDGEANIEYSIHLKRQDVNRIFQILSDYRINSIRVEEPSFEDMISKFFGEDQI